MEEFPCKDVRVNVEIGQAPLGIGRVGSLTSLVVIITWVRHGSWFRGRGERRTDAILFRFCHERLELFRLVRIYPYSILCAHPQESVLTRPLAARRKASSLAVSFRWATERSSHTHDNYCGRASQLATSQYHYLAFYFPGVNHEAGDENKTKKEAIVEVEWQTQ